MSYNDYFIANDNELERAFPKWKRAAPLLDDFINITAKNPFSGASVTLRTLIPQQQPDPDPNAPLTGEYQQLPWIDLKNLMPTDLACLAIDLMGWDHDRASSELN